MRKQAEMSIEVKENGQYIEHIAYPYVEYDHVTFENGMQIEKVLEDDVAMPTVTHDTSSFKVGQGESDVSESIVDSSVASMTIKGQTYQNILPSPTLRNSMTDGNTMQKINEGYDSVEVVDGYVKSAILKGNTLVNLVTTDTSNGYTLINDGTGIKGNRLDLIDGFDNKNYTFVLEFSDVNIVNENPNWGVYITVLSLEDNGADNLTIKSHVKNGKVTFLYRPSRQRKTINNFSISLHSDSGVGSTITITNVVVLEGDYTNVDIPYFTGMQSVKMPVLTTTGKNLLDPKNMELVVSDRNHANLFTYDETNDSYEFLCSDSFNQMNIKFKNLYGITSESQIYVSGTYDSDGSVHEVTRRIIVNTDVISIQIIHDWKPVTKANLKIMITSDTNNTTTTHEPYKTNILTVNDDVTLRGIGDVQDTLDCLTGEITERIGEIVLDGSEDEGWTILTSTGSGATYFRCAINNLQPSGSQTIIPPNLINDKLPLVKYYDMYTGIVTDNVAITSGSTVQAIFVWNSNIEKTESAIRNYLQQNPITVQYRLAKESVKTVDLSILDQDNQPVEQLQSYANGYIQLSSNVAEGEYSLTPSIEYEVPTSNSYYVDLAKPSTQYTMKNMQGTFTIDGIQYNASVNGTFTSPSTLSNRLMITNVVQTQPMLLEGDMTSKEVPYVDGIKSAFEDESKIEVLSTGKNLFDGRLADGFYNNANFIVAGDTKVFKSVKLFCKAGRYVMSFSKKVNIVRLLKENTYSIVSETNINTYSFTVNKDSYCGISFRDATSVTTVWDDNTLIQIEETQSPTTYQPYKSNSTKIPLLSPLRSLPNGVRDEIILDRQNHKAKLIQRVGEDLTQLPSPIVTQVDIEGFPYVYKDGHIFLNTEVAPMTEVKYSINQSQIIESQSEDIVRHSKEIDNLYNLIATYVQVNYDSTLLNLKTKGV